MCGEPRNEIFLNNNEKKSNLEKKIMLGATNQLNKKKI